MTPRERLLEELLAERYQPVPPPPRAAATPDDGPHTPALDTPLQLTHKAQALRRHRVDTYLAEGSNPHDIAQALGIPIAYIRNRQKRARGNANKSTGRRAA